MSTAIPSRTSATFEDSGPSDRSQRAPYERVIASFEGDEPGPTTIVVCAIHGNEPMGERAARRVFAMMHRGRERLRPFRGRAFAIVGNHRALQMGVRLIDRDLNRAFTYDRSSNGPLLRNATDPHDVESRERRELITTLQSLIAKSDPGEDVIILDLHTYSSDGPPFVVFADTLRNRKFARCWPLPSILGLAETISGTLAAYVTELGCISAAVETGRHDDDVSRRHFECALRLAFVHAGHVDPGVWPDLEADRRMLRDAVRGVPSVLDVQYRHAIAPGDGFRMRPDFENFHPVRVGTHVADDNTGAIRTHRHGRLLMPLYQTQGEDGFFVARPIHPIWLALSSFLRMLRVPRLAPLLPGVRRDPEDPRRSVLVDARVARFLTRDVFHILGYRLAEHNGRSLVFSRRAWDRNGPERVEM